MDALVKRKFIRTMEVENAFRGVDRGLYFPDGTFGPYTGFGIKSEYIYLSSASLYAIALESLKLQTGHRFLNVGSGIGYFSTLAGLLLGKCCEILVIQLIFKCSGSGFLKILGADTSFKKYRLFWVNSGY